MIAIERCSLREPAAPPDGAARPLPGPAGPVRRDPRTRSSRPCRRSPTARPTSSGPGWRSSRRPSPPTWASRHCVGVNSRDLGPAPGPDLRRRRAGRRGHHGPDDLRRHLLGHQLRRGDAGLRRRRPGHLHDGRPPGRAADHPPDPGDPAGPPVRAAGRHGAAAGDRPTPRHPGHRGRRPGARGPLSRAGGPARSGSAAASASTPARTSAPTARRARS